VQNRIKPLEPPDTIHLSAAEGWLGLGNPLEANEELEKITPQLRNHPDVLEVRWQIYTAENKWNACVDIAQAITKLAPSRSTGWIYLSVALHELKRTKEARDNLMGVEQQFPDQYLIRYNLACYESRLGNLKKAYQLLKKAIELAATKDIRAMALHDVAHSASVGANSGIVRRLKPSVPSCCRLLPFFDIEIIATARHRWL
jgi:tetratricopeptide (TPR) repeat protein